MKFRRGALIAPLSAPLCLYVGIFVFQLVKGRLGDDLSDWLVTGPIMALGWGLIVGYPSMFLLGLPYVNWLFKKDILSIEYVCGGALVLGIVVSILFALMLGGEPSFLLGGIFSCLSVITAYVFCKIEGIKKKTKHAT